MAKTFQFTVDNVGNPEPVTAQSVCKRIYIREQGAAGTTDYFVRQPGMTDPQERKTAGEWTMFEAAPGNFFRPGDIVGYVETVTGSVTFSQREE